MFDLRPFVAVLLVSLGCAGAPPAAPSREGAEPTEPAAPDIVAVNWLGRGRRFAARVVEERHGLTGVQYADGEREWVPPERIGPLPELTGRAIQIYVRGSAQAATVLERRETLFHVRLGDGADTWIDGTMLYAIDEEPAPPPPPPPPVFARRRPVDPARVRPGAIVLAYWTDGEAPSLSQPWVCRVRAVHDGRAELLYSDGSEATVPLDFVLHVFAPVGRLRAGDRVWVREGNAVGLVVERMGRLVRIAYSTEEQSWLEATEVVGRLDAIDRDRVVAGAHATVRWQSGAPYHATVLSRDGDSVTVQWHDGSAASAVHVGDVLEVWEAR